MAVPSPSTPRATGAATKAALRAEALKRRRAFAASLAPSTRAALEAALTEIVLPHLVGARIVAGYHPLKDEISPYPLLARLGAGQRAALPWFASRDARMMFRAAPAVEPGPWTVLQPAAEAEALAPDTILVPLVAADSAGNRIGHGKGHYDRAIAHLRAGGVPVRAIGLAWTEQLLDRPIPADPWDMPLDAVATPAGWIARA